MRKNPKKKNRNLGHGLLSAKNINLHEKTKPMSKQRRNRTSLRQVVYPKEGKSIAD